MGENAVTQFLDDLSRLRSARLRGEDALVGAAALERAAARLREGATPPACRIVPFSPGRRPTDEATSPGLGSSDQAAMLFGTPHNGRGPNRAYILYELDEDSRARDEVEVDVTLSLTGPDGTDAPRALDGWNHRRVAPAAFTLADGGRPVLRPAGPGDHKLVVELDPETDLAPPPGVADPYGFSARYLQRVRVDLRASEAGVPLAAATTTLDVCSVPALGSLYTRVLDRVVAPDAARQAAACGETDPGPAYHPWYPALRVGSDKAALYTRALIGDIVGKGNHLTDPLWLLRVGVYLELLTCLGIAEAVQDDLGDILEPGERTAFESSGQYEQIRRRVDPEAWKSVWALRHITFPRLGAPRAGPVSALNLLNKKKTTLAFLHVHHGDLKHAVALAGPNEHNAQETWQRVFRDAERAVLRQTADAFPELGFLPRAARDVVLWHRRGRLEPLRNLRVPRSIMALLADQDGLFVSACTQYRASMNHVADWAKGRGLMDHTAAECVPVEVSLLEAHERDPARLAALQHRDGYGATLDVVEAEEAQAPPLDDAIRLLSEVPIFSVLDEEQLAMLARLSRPLPFGPMQRVVVQNRPGTSLFVIADGELEVVVRQDDGEDVVVGTRGRGAVVGEMSLLTGEPRAATLRAVDGALVYEIGCDQFDPLLDAHPEWIADLAGVMERRLAAQATTLAARAEGPDRGRLAELIRKRPRSR
jgi:CRP-like cAMP-binding protein